MCRDVGENITGSLPISNTNSGPAALGRGAHAFHGRLVPAGCWFIPQRHARGAAWAQARSAPATWAPIKTRSKEDHERWG